MRNIRRWSSRQFCVYECVFRVYRNTANVVCLRFLSTRLYYPWFSQLSHSQLNHSQLNHSPLRHSQLCDSNAGLDSPGIHSERAQSALNEPVFVGLELIGEFC